MTLQKDLKIYRFGNIKPNDGKKYDYQLFRNMQRIANKLSDNEFHVGSVIVNESNVSLTLIQSNNDINFREMEEQDTYLVPVTICK